MTPVSVGGARFVGLDGLRAVAVIFVLIYHLTPGMLRGGFIGVDIFFVVSGFLITSLLLRERAANGRISLSGFWRRRARRLLPALALVVLVCSSAAFLVRGDTLVNLGRQVFGAATFSSNWIYIADGGSYFTRDTPELFRNLWSLAVEEQFYIVWPLLLLLILLLRSRAAPVLAVLLLALVSASLMGQSYVPGSDPTRAYFGSDTHSFGLTLGAALALFMRPRQNTSTIPRAASPAVLWAVGALSSAAIVWAAISLEEEGGFTYQGGLFLVSVAAAALVWVVTNPKIRFGNTLDSRPLRYVGERSYGLYLWHWPLFVLVQAAFHDLGRSAPVGWLAGGIALTFTVAFAHLSYRFVEQPVRKFGLRGAARAALSSVHSDRLRFMTASITAAVLLVTVTGSTAAITLSVTANSATDNILRGESALHNQNGSTPTSPAPTAVPPPQKPLPAGSQLTAVGDSVMLASAPELQAAFPGISIDAAVSRSFYSGLGVVQAMAAAGTLSDVLIVGLGTNGPVDADDLEALRVAADGRPIVLVNAFAPRDWIPGVNDLLTSFAARYRNVELANWHDSIAPHLDLLAGDQVHPDAEGGALYAASVQAALQRLADLPPLRTGNDFGLAGPPA
ncbi:acyltransferase family protein [Lysinibacter cavernae]|uniref:Peptidoglycan/LPS O-acetylase OafA/YrhL n=1 Tax=Lysinibacter cavernae TaxID=1640652 RepID=A0A7X5R1X8_9MICO|nr:peptidoglycan/LPS O-acetylase OafA/YrhL [Lysinibacter cavernae]